MRNKQDSTFTRGTPARASAARAALWASCILHVVLAVSGCAKTQAASVPDGPALAVPAAPPRVLAPPADEPLAENPPEPESAPAPPRTTASPPRANQPRRPPVTTAAPAEEPKSDTPAPQTPPVVTEAPPLRPAPTPADAAAERRVRDVMRRAAADLGRVNYQRLSTDGKAQYEQSKRFNEQAEQAIKDRNYIFAMTLADKAAALATELQGR